MEFWGVEVKAGEQLKVQPEFGKLIHISQAALGEVKDVKGPNHIPLRLKIDGKNFILGTLSAEERTQLMFDLVFEREFELFHDWKKGSVYFIGYSADDPVSDGEDFSDEFNEISEDELVDTKENGAIMPKIGVAGAAKNVKSAPGEMLFGISQNEDSSDVSGDDSEDDTDGSFSSDDELPKVQQQSKKRPAESAQLPAVPAKKTKSASLANSGNIKGHKATPLPSKKAGKGPIINKSKEKNHKSSGQKARN